MSERRRSLGPDQLQSFNLNRLFTLLSVAPTRCKDSGRHMQEARVRVFDLYFLRRSLVESSESPSRRVPVN